MIEINNLTKSYQKEFSALFDVSLHVDKNKIVLYGEEGSGKTTLLNLIAGLDLDYDGEIKIDGLDRKSTKNEDLLISYIPHDPVLFNNKTVYENLRYFMKNVLGEKNNTTIKNAIIQKLKDYSLEGCANIKVKKLNRLDKLMVSLIRVELKKSRILLLDEPLKDLTELEKTHLINSLNCLVIKLSSDVLVVDNGQNLRYFDDYRKINLSFGAIKM